MRISDWSSDVCSSDLPLRGKGQRPEQLRLVSPGHEDEGQPARQSRRRIAAGHREGADRALLSTAGPPADRGHWIGSASWRERVSQYVEDSVGVVCCNKKQTSL